LAIQRFGLAAGTYGETGLGISLPAQRLTSKVEAGVEQGVGATDQISRVEVEYGG